MSETEKPETESSTKSASASKAPKSDDTQKYSVERLLTDAYELTGYPRHIVAGALSGASGDLSASQAVSKVEKFLGAEVKEG